MRTRTMLSLALAAALLPSTVVTVASAAPDKSGQSVCDPMHSGKIDVSGDQVSVTVEAPAEHLISGYCVKAGSDQSTEQAVRYVDLPREEWTSTLTITHPSGKAVSHYSLMWERVAVPVTDPPVEEEPAPEPPVEEPPVVVPPVDEDVLICHAMDDGSVRPWVPAIVPQQDIIDGTGLHGGHVNDIIPPFEGFEGRNWDAEGQEVFGYRCQVHLRDNPPTLPEQPVEEAPVEEAPAPVVEEDAVTTPAPAPKQDVIHNPGPVHTHDKVTTVEGGVKVTRTVINPAPASVQQTG